MAVLFSTIRTSKRSVSVGSSRTTATRVITAPCPTSPHHTTCQRVFISRRGDARMRTVALRTFVSIQQLRFVMRSVAWAIVRKVLSALTYTHTNARTLRTRASAFEVTSANTGMFTAHLGCGSLPVALRQRNDLGQHLQKLTLPMPICKTGVRSPWQALHMRLICSHNRSTTSPSTLRIRYHVSPDTRH
jgi:hypothetical protein